jgi:hypothetical protein
MITSIRAISLTMAGVVCLMICFRIFQINQGNVEYGCLKESGRHEFWVALSSGDNL